MSTEYIVKELVQTYSANTHDDLSIITTAASGVNSKAFFDFVTISGFNKEEAANYLMYH